MTTASLPAFSTLWDVVLEVSELESVTLKDDVALAEEMACDFPM